MESFNWDVQSIDGHSTKEIYEKLTYKKMINQKF